MTGPGYSEHFQAMAARSTSGPRRRRDRVRRHTSRVFREFLGLPCLVVAGYGLLAAASVAVDRTSPQWLHPLLTLLGGFISKGAAANLLSAVATSVVTITAITFSVLLLAVQQTAAAMTPVVFDQFLRRRTNQLYLGMFVGLSVYAFVDLATIKPSVVPVFGASLALGLTILSLFALMLLIFSTVEQMRPSSVLQVIHDHAMRARAAEFALFTRTRRTSAFGGNGDGAGDTAIHAERDGYVTRIGLKATAEAVSAIPEAEVRLLITLGSHVAFNQPIATVRAHEPVLADSGADAIRRAVRLDRHRDLDTDASFAVTELGNVAWTGISSAKHNPQMGREAIDRLSDLLARWSHEQDFGRRVPGGGSAARGLPIVYQDTDVEHLIETIVGLLVVSAESAQPDTAAYIIRAISTGLPDLAPQALDGIQQALIATLPAVEEQVLTRPLQRALGDLRDTLCRLNATAAADVVGRRLDEQRTRSTHG